MKSLTICLILSLSGVSLGQDWPSWRGPAGDGFATSSSAPVTWDRTKNVKWRIPLARPSNGSPIVVGDFVFLAMAEDEDGHRRSLYCFDKNNGKQVWVRTVDFGRTMPTHKTNPYCGTTPVSDGERVIVWHSSAGLWCYDMTGKELWHRDFGEFRHQWGYGTSPVLHGKMVILQSGPGEQAFVAALDKTGGKTIWKSVEPNHLDEEAIKKKRLAGSWCTPRIVRVEDRVLIVSGHATRVVAYDAEDGRIVWWCGGVPCGRGDLVYSSPVIARNVCMVIGGYEGPSIGVALDGRGDVTETHRRWYRPKQKSNVGSGIYFEGAIYMSDIGSQVSRIDPETGDATWVKRLGRGKTWGSIVSCGGRLYLMNQKGTTVVFSPTKEGPGIIAENALGEPTNSTPVFAGGEIFLRTHKALWCISKRP